MPILHSQLGGKGTKPDGSEVQLSPAAVLAGRGPVFQVSISLSPAMAGPLVQQGQPVPAPVSGVALIDTGASGTCIDIETAAAMGLPVIGTAKIVSASQAEVDAPLFAIQIAFVGTPLILQSQHAVGATLKPQNLIALIGRDSLSGSVVIYNGPTGSITLCL